MGTDVNETGWLHYLNIDDEHVCFAYISHTPVKIAQTSLIFKSNLFFIFHKQTINTKMKELFDERVLLGLMQSN